MTVPTELVFFYRKVNFSVPPSSHAVQCDTDVRHIGWLLAILALLITRCQSKANVEPVRAEHENYKKKIIFSTVRACSITSMCTDDIVVCLGYFYPTFTLANQMPMVPCNAQSQALHWHHWAYVGPVTPV